MSNVILIGNGPSLLDHRLGRVIDTYDLVVRFNSYVVHGFEDHVGSKTDIWFSTGCPQNHTPRDYYRTYWHSWCWEAHKDTNFQRFLVHYPDAIKTNRDMILGMQKISGNKRYQDYSTGAIAAHILVEEFGQVSIAGFDWWSDNPVHHYCDKVTRGTLHKPNHELRFFNSLVKSHKVVDLNPDSILGDSSEKI